MTRLAALIAALAVTAVAAPLPAAGAASHAKSPAAKREAAFKRQANHACAWAGARVAHLPAVDDKNIAHVMASEAGILASLTKRLKAVDAPKAKAAKYAKLVAAAQRQVTRLRAALKAAKRGDKRQTAADLKAVIAAGDEADRLSGELQLAACVRDYTPGVG